jgi:hypothetical protein
VLLSGISRRRILAFLAISEDRELYHHIQRHTVTTPVWGSSVLIPQHARPTSMPARSFRTKFVKPFWRRVSWRRSGTRISCPFVQTQCDQFARIKKVIHMLERAEEGWNETLL